MHFPSPEICKWYVKFNFYIFYLFYNNIFSLHLHIWIHEYIPISMDFHTKRTTFWLLHTVACNSPDLMCTLESAIERTQFLYLYSLYGWEFLSQLLLPPGKSWLLIFFSSYYIIYVSHPKLTIFLKLFLFGSIHLLDAT